MTEPKKYKMRPARKKPDGSLQMVPIGYINGHRSALASEGMHAVTPSIHRAYLAGDIDIDDYPYPRVPTKRAKPAKDDAAPAAKKASKSKTSSTAKPKSDDAAESKAEKAEQD